MENRHILSIKGRELLLPVGIIFIAILFRFLPHVPNITPIAAMSLFGGAYLSRRYALILPLAAMFLSDLFLGFHPVMPFVYGSFLVSGLIGIWLKTHKNAGYIIGATLVSSLLFFIVTNFGVWLTSGMYVHSFAGLLEAYVMGMPFFRNTLLGDLLYTGLLFGGFEAVKVFISQRILAPQK